MRTPNAVPCSALDPPTASSPVHSAPGGAVQRENDTGKVEKLQDRSEASESWTGDESSASLFEVGLCAHFSCGFLLGRGFCCLEKSQLKFLCHTTSYSA